MTAHRDHAPVQLALPFRQERPAAEVAADDDAPPPLAADEDVPAAWRVFN